MKTLNTNAQYIYIESYVYTRVYVRNQPRYRNRVQVRKWNKLSATSVNKSQRYGEDDMRYKKKEARERRKVVVVESRSIKGKENGRRDTREWVHVCSCTDARYDIIRRDYR